MRSYKKILVVACVSFALVFVPMRDSKAVIPALIAGWLLEITGGSILVSDLVAGQAGIIAAVMWWDCNKFKFNAPCTSKSPMPATQAPKPAITVNLKPDAKRENPNPQKFNDPSPNSASPRDVTPKQEIAAGGTPAPPAPSGPVGTGVYAQDPVNDPQSGPTSQSTLQYMAAQSHAYGDVEVAGVITVKQMFAPDRAFPFVAKVSTCNWNAPVESGYADKSAECTARSNASNASLESRWMTPDRYAYWISMPASALPSGVTVGGKAVIFYDLAKDVTVSCDPGYKVSSSDPSKCQLVDASQVKKPADTPCEVLYDPVTKVMMTDKANPGCDGLESSKTVTLASEDGSQSIEVKANAGNGFDITITKGDGSKTALDTGVYDPGTGGYVVVHVNYTPPPNPDNGMGCGGPGQGLCAVEEPGDNATWIKSNDTQAKNRAGDTDMKGKMDGISSSKFDWSFIPAIPTASCSNPTLKSPIGNASFSMDLCTWFDRLSFFINAVLAVLCVYGCVNMVQNALKD